MKYILFIIIIGASFSSFSQVEFKASVSKDAVMTGEPFKLEYKINQNFENFTLPEFEHFEILSGPSTSMQQSVNITNGEMVKTVSVTYTYFVKAITSGTQTIQPAEIEIEGEFFYSNSVEVLVIEGNYQNPKEDKGKDIKGTSRL